MIWFSCGKCDKTISRPETSAGALVFCDCGQGNTVPWESTVPAPAQPLPERTPAVFPPLSPLPVSEENIPVVRPAPSAPRRGEPQDRPAAAPLPSGGDVCLNHPDRAGQEKCAACGESFCGDCLIKFKGQSLCGPCKNFRLRETTRPSSVSGKAVLGVVLAMCFAPLIMCGMPFEGTRVSLVIGAVALLGQLLAILLGAVALVETEKDPRLSGRSLAITTLLTGGLATLVTVCFMVFTLR
jgi:hypothetical protein